ncbi:MAG: glycoside hydrolase family 95 protein [Rikenellaceae bacterium]
MKKETLKLVAFILPILLFTGCNGSDHTAYISELRYDSPAEQWEESLPLGNGRLGMMPDGDPFEELFVLNEISMWNGSVDDYSNPNAGEMLPTIRQLLFEGKNKEAQELMYKHFVPIHPDKNSVFGCYQLLANLSVNYALPDQAPITCYQRGLLLDSATAYTTFEQSGVKYKRSYFISRHDDVMVIKIDADKLGQVAFDVSLNRPESPMAETLAGGAISLCGELPSGQKDVEGMKYQILVDVKTEGDNVKRKSANGAISVTDCDYALIIISATTNYLAGEQYQQKCAELLTEAIAKPYNSLLEESVESYRELYDRAKLELVANSSVALLPTDERIEAFQTTDDPSLAALYYNYGRYLLISSTREGSLPPNLQGLWANQMVTPWKGDYHTNINLQMNHWPAEQGNLSELHLPLIEFTKSLIESGRETAKVFYGDSAEGWVLHMRTNIWGYTVPGRDPSWGSTNTGGAWLCAHLWEHYLFNLDKKYLAEIYPVMKEAADFFLSTMVVDPNSGWLVTAPTSSPENSFLIGDDPTPISICMGPTMDTQIVSELYTNVIQAASILGVDEQNSQVLKAAYEQFPPHKISDEGYLMEWLEDYTEADPHHRHVSHLYGLHPGNQISVVKTPELAEACRNTLNRRGDGGTGWSRAWKINFWARLGDGDRAYTLFKSLLAPAYTREEPKHGSGTFPNLFCSHDPFQIDGNWGGASGISEMLLQSQDGFINLLPALPTSWQNGSFRGFRVRGGATVDLAWENAQITECTITADRDDQFTLKLPNGAINAKGSIKSAISVEDDVNDFVVLNLKAGEPLMISFIY